MQVTLVLLGFFGLWEAGVRAFDTPGYLLPAPTVILAEFLNEPLWYGVHAAYTVGACLMGFGLALVIGILMAIGIVYSRILENTLYTLLVSLNSIPKIALAPLFIIWMGTGTASKVAVAMLIALFSIVIDTVLGLRSVEPDALDLSRSMRASPMQILMEDLLSNGVAGHVRGHESGDFLGPGRRHRWRVRRFAGWTRLRDSRLAGDVSDDTRVRRCPPARHSRHDFVLCGGLGRADPRALARVTAEHGSRMRSSSPD